MSLHSRITLVLASCFAMLGASASAKVEYVPVRESHVRTVLASIADGDEPKLLSGNADEALVARARRAAGECPLGRRVIYNRPGWSIAQINLTCAEDEQIGFLLMFLEGKWVGTELYPSGIVVVAPPASPSFKSNED